MRQGLASIFWCRWLMAGLVLLALSPAAAPGQAPWWEALMRQGAEALRGARFAEAERALQAALQEASQRVGPEHPDMAATLNGLGWLSRSLGRLGEAESRFQWALAVREKAFGPEHPEVAESLEAYAVLLRQTQREAEAAPLEARARAIRARLGREGPVR